MEIQVVLAGRVSCDSLNAPRGQVRASSSAFRSTGRIFIERFWHIIKYEPHGPLRTYSDGPSLTEYFYFYNNERKYQSLGHQIPAVWYERGRKSSIFGFNPSSLKMPESCPAIGDHYTVLYVDQLQSTVKAKNLVAEIMMCR